jgi:hypothetical protein
MKPRYFSSLREGAARIFVYKLRLKLYKTILPNTSGIQARTQVLKIILNFGALPFSFLRIMQELVTNKKDLHFLPLLW